MDNRETNKQVVRDLIRLVWEGGNLDALGDFWTDDAVNHAQPGGNRGLAALRAYHEQFGAAFAVFADLTNEIVQQVAEGDTVVTHLVTRGVHTGDFAGTAATGRTVTLAAMRIDRISGGKIAEHWSVSDFAGLMQQLQ